MSEDKIVEGRKYTKKVLDEIMKKYEAILFGEYKKITRDTSIHFTCKCGKIDKKIFRAIVENAGALCKQCSKTHMVETMKKTMTEKYGVEHSMSVPEFKKKQENTMIEKYGVSHNSLNPTTIQKRKDTLKDHFGVAHHFQLPEKIEERRQKCLLKFGVEHHLKRDDILDKQRQTNLKKRGVEYSLQNIEVKNKAIKTNIEKYGVEHPSQNADIMEKTQKNAKKYKEYKMPSGEIRKVQGYEPFALNELIKSYTEDQIKTERKEVPRIPYEADGKKKYYFPDIYIPHEKKIIEVKSTWTYKCKTDNIELKKNATIALGYTYEIWCFDGKGKRIEV